MNTIKDYFRNVLAFRFQAMILSSLVILVCVVGILVQGGLLYGIDFTGGLRLLLAFDDPLSPQEMRQVRSVFTENFSSSKVQTVSLQGEDQRRGIMVVVRAQEFVDTLTNQLYRAGQSGAEDPWETINAVGSNSLIGLDVLRENFSMGATDDQRLDLTQSSVEDIRSSVRSMVNQVLSNRVLELLRSELVRSQGTIDLNWANADQIQAWLVEQQVNGLVERILELRNKNQLNQDSLTSLLDRFALSPEAFMSTFRIGEGASGQFDLRTIPESNLRNIIFEDFFQGKFAKDAATIVKKRSNRGLFRDKPDVMQLSVMDNFYKSALEKSFYLSPFIIKSREMISPAIGAELVTQAALAILLSLVGILIYLYVRFELNYSFGAVAAIIHDVLITVGIITILGVEFNVPVVAAVLTVIGYSLNDTIVNFDRVRENRVLMGHNAKWFNIINRSVIEVLNRTVVTSLTTFISAMVLYLFGGVSLNGFAITLLVGIVAGTYSSIFVSNVVFFELQRRFG